MTPKWWLFIVLFVLYQAAKIIYRLFFHPLARFPGPKIAAATKWYEAYLDLRPHRPGTFFREIERMHRIYGPIVRINPDELHVDDSSWADKLYVMPARGVRNKHVPAALMTGNPGGGGGTILHELHRKRRASIGPLFSKASAAASTEIIYDKVDLLLRNISDQIESQGYAEMQVNWMAFVSDTLTECFFDNCMGLLMDQRRAREWMDTITAVAASTPFAKQFLWFIPMASKLPMWILKILNPEVSRLVKLQRDMLVEAKEAVQLYSKKDSSAKKPLIRHHLFSTILLSPVLDLGDKEPIRMAQEAFLILVAGSDTTAQVISTAIYYILTTEKKAMSRIQSELEQVMPDLHSRAGIQDLERLPWLTAVIKESLRLSAVVTSRSPLVAPHETLQYKNWLIPPGTAIGMSLRDILLDHSVFEDPDVFRPERWLDNNPGLAQINRYFLPFSRGSRMCIGVNHAMSMMYIALAVFFRRHQWTLHDTVYERDVEIQQDCFNGKASPQSTGVRVKKCANNLEGREKKIPFQFEHSEG